MICDNCGAELVRARTDLPFKRGPHSTVIVRDVPVMECSACPMYLMDDEVMASIDGILAARGSDVELEVVRFAA
jgi:YgiT-type zinc finger domain-containing protein